jgi:hypothetical protein
MAIYKIRDQPVRNERWLLSEWFHLGKEQDS